MTAAPPVYIVVLTFNRWQDTRACLTSVFACSYSNIRVLVIDNGSKDETLDELPVAFQVHLIRNSRNLGYAEGNNVGLRYALAEGAEFTVVLNNDVIVAQDWLEPLVQAAQSDPRAALLGPMVYHIGEPRVIQSAGGILPGNWHTAHRGANEPDLGQFSRTEAVDWLTGCAILARSSALREIGLLDPAFYMYGEDVDWGVRASRAGYRILFVPRSRVWHKGVQRNYAPAPQVTYYSARNELQLIRKHHGGSVTLARAFARHARTISSWTLRPRWRGQRAHRDALARALVDFVRGSSGQIDLV